MISNLLRFIGLRHLTTKKLRTVLTVLGVGFGVGLFIAVDLINRATLRSFKDNIEAVAGSADFTISAGGPGFPEEVLEKVEKIPGVQRAIPMVEDRAYLTGPRSSETLVIFGVDLLKEQAVRQYETVDGQMIDDPLVFLNQPDSLIVSSTFAKEHGLKLDSKIELATAGGSKIFTVRGILVPSGPAKAYGGAVAIMDIDGARFSFGKEGRLDRIDVVVAENDSADTVLKRCQSELGSGFSIEKPHDQAEQMNRLVSAFQKLLVFMSSLAVLVGLFMVTHSVSVAVAERRREIGSLRALGTTRSSILLLFVSESFLIGIIGSLIGAGAGWLLSFQLVKSVALSISNQMLTQLALPEIAFNSTDLLRALAIGSGVSVVAALWPAFKATRIGPLEAIRDQSAVHSASERRLSFSRFAVGVALLALFTLSTVQGWAAKTSWGDFVNQVSSMAGAILVTPMLATLISMAFRKISLRASSAVGRLSQENLLRDPKRTSSNVLALMVGLIMVVLISSINSSFRLSVASWLDKILHADLLVSSHGRMFAFQTQPLDESLGGEIETSPAVTDALQYPVRGLRFIRIQHEGRTVAIKAFDRPDPALGYVLFDVKDRSPQEAGDDLFNGKKPVILVSRNFVTHFGKRTGDEIVLNTPTGPIRALIGGMVTDFASNQGVIYMDRAIYKKHWRDPLINVFYLKLKEGADRERIRARIDESFGRSRNLMVTLNSELKSDVIRSVDQSFAYGRALEGAALLIALLGLMNTFFISVMERTRELGLLRAVGMSRPQTFKMILLESLSQGLIATVLAIVLGSWTAFLWIRYSLEDAMGWTIQFHFPYATVLTAVALGLLVSIVAGFWPARRAAFLDIKEALAYE